MTNINSEQYKLLCKTCDDVLLDSSSTPECVSISWLHIIREHPVFIKPYQGIFSSNSLARACKECLLNLIKLALWFKSITVSFLTIKFYKKYKFQQECQVDYLFVSHLLDNSQYDSGNDFYFSDTFVSLLDVNKTSFVALINHTKEEYYSNQDVHGDGIVPHFILPKKLRLKDEFSILYRLIKESIRLRRLSINKTGLRKNVLLKASNEALSQPSANNFRIAIQIQNLVKKIRPKFIVLTHEGYAWERLTFSMARSAYPDIRCIGYQHASLFRLQHAIFRSLSMEYNPDIILTAGSVTKKRLEGLLGLNKIPIYLLGSPRSLVDFRRSNTRIDNSDQITCLVLPEGLDSECHLIYDFSLRCAILMPGVKFIWRLHPLISFRDLTRKNNKLQRLPENIILSNSSIEKDIECSQFSIYRGSTAIITALSSGIQPIYLSLQDEMTIDPLFELDNKWRKIVMTSEEVQKLIVGNDSLSSDFLREAKNIAIDHAKSLFTPMNHKTWLDCK